MSIQSQSTSLALQDILLGIADSLNDAQQQLRSLPPYDEYGRPNTMYQLPYLDFNLQVTSEFETQTTQNSPGTQNIGRMMNILRFNPAGKVTISNNSSQIVSTISGRFVAVVPNEGMPQVVLEVKTLKSANSNIIEIEANLSNVLGERISNSRVEFNFDEQYSKMVNENHEVGESGFTIKEGNTDDNGTVKTTVTLPSNDYNNNRIFVFVVNAGTVSKSISISK